jgi:Cu+-exporting ATPase
MDVSEQDAPARAQHEGQTFYFCSTECKEQFEQDPGRYARRSA